MEDKRLITRVERLHQSTAREKQRFSIRKLSVGATSVFLGTTFFLGTQNNAVHADTNSDVATEKSNETVKSDNTDKLAEHNIAVKSNNQTENASATQDNNDLTSNVDSTTSDNTTTENTKNGKQTSDSQNVDTKTQPSGEVEKASEIEKNISKNEEKQDAKDETPNVSSSKIVINNNDNSANTANNDKTNTTPEVKQIAKDVKTPANARLALANTAAKQVEITYHAGDKSWNDTLEINEGQDIQAAVQAEIDKDNAIQDERENQSPLLYQYTSDKQPLPNQPITDYDGTGALKDQYEAWLKKKNAEFPLAGYTLESVVSNGDDKYIVNLADPGYSTFIAVNDWKVFKRIIEFKKYYGDADTSTFKQDETIGYAVPSTNPKVPARPSISKIHPGGIDNTQNAVGTATTIDQVNSKTSTLPDAPKGGVNQILWIYITPRYYNPVTGQIDLLNSTAASSNSVLPIQFDGAKVDPAIDNGLWTTTEGDVEKTSANFQNDDNAYGITTGRGFVRNKTTTYDPPTEYIIYYHNQPVTVTFEDVTDSNNIIDLSNFNAPELTWKDSSDTFVTRQESDNDVKELKLKDTKEVQGSGTKYSYQSGDYTKSGDLTTDSHATAANTAINGLSTLNYQDVLKAYLDNGYALVSVDSDDLSYDKDKVWSKDSADTENDGHKLNVLHRVIKLVRVAQEHQDTKTVTRKINFVADREGEPQLADSITQTVTYNSSKYYTDSNGTQVAVKTGVDVNGNQIFIVDDNAAVTPITWTAQDGDKFNEVVMPTNGDGNTLVDQSTIKVPSGDLEGTWTKNSVAQESDVPAPTSVSGDWNGYIQDATDKTKYTVPDVTLVYTKDINSTVSFWDVTDGLAKKQPLHDVLKDSDEHGKTGQAITWSTNPQGVIDELLNKGYVLVSQGFNTPDDTWSSSLTYGKEDTHYNIYFIHGTSIVPPSDTPDYPANAKDKDVKTQVTQSRVIRYFDADELVNGKPKSLNDSYGVKDKTQSVTWGRTAIYDAVTGDLLGYAKDNEPEYTMYDKDGNVTQDADKAVAKVATVNGDGSWTVTSQDKDYPEVASYDLTSKGYKAQRSLSTTFDTDDNGKVAAQKDADPTQDGGEVDIYYFHNIVPVTPDTPEGGDGTDVVDPKSLSKEAKRTINFVSDYDHSYVLQNPINQSISYKGVAYVDMVTKKQVNATEDKDRGYIEVNKDKAPEITWTSSSENFDKDTNGFDKAVQPTIEKDGKTWYYVGEDGNNVDISGLTTDNNNWPEIKDATLNYKTKASYNVHYIDVNDIIKPEAGYTKDSGVELTDHEIKGIGTGENEYVGDTPNETAKLWLAHTPDGKGYEDLGYVLVQSDKNLADQELTDDVQDQYVFLVHNREVKPNEVTHTRVIKYFDADDLDDNGDPKSLENLAPSVTQSVKFTQNAIYDKVTGKILGYTKDANSKDDNGLVAIDDSLNADNSWIADGSGFYEDADTENGSQVSPDLTDYGYQKVVSFNKQTNNGDAQEVVKKQGSPLEDGGEVDVYYYHATIPVTPIDPNFPPRDPNTPINPKGDAKYPSGLTKEDLEVTKSRTITYVNGVTNEPVNGSPEGTNKEVQSVTFYKSAIVDKVNGKLLGYDTTGDGKVDVEVSDPDAAWYILDKDGKRVTTNKQTVPSLESKKPSEVGYDTVDTDVVSSVVATPTTDLEDVVVKYYRNPVVETHKVVVNYVDEDGNVIKDPVTESNVENGKDYTTTDKKPATIEKDGKTYEFVRVDKNSDPESGTINGKDVEVTYVYKLKEDNPVVPTPDEPVTPVDPSTPVNPTPDQPVTPTPTEPSEPTTPSTPDTPSEPDTPSPSEPNEPSTPSDDTNQAKPSTPNKTSYKESSPSKFEDVSDKKKYREATAALHKDMDNLKKGTKTSYKSSVVPKSDKILPQTGEKSNTAAEVAGIMTAALAGLVGLVGTDRKKKRR